MSKTFATLQAEVYQELQDITPTYLTSASIIQEIETAIRKISEVLPREWRYHYFIESRTGTATATTASALVDSTEAQFVSTDVGKVIYNTTDKTWAVVTAYVSTSQLTLSKDIMANNEKYKMFNKDCVSEKQINLADIEDYVGDHRGVIAVEYPIGTRRSFTVEDDILTIKVDSVSDSKVVTSGDQTNTEVLIWVNRRHYVSQLTDLVGAIDLGAGYAAGITTIHVDGLGATEVIAEDTDFTIANVRGKYTVTASTTLAGNEGDITIFPSLESAVADDVVVTFIGSTLPRLYEHLVVDIAASYAAISWAAKVLTQTELAITRLASVNNAINDMVVNIIRAGDDLSSGRTEVAKVAALVTTAATAIAKISQEINEARTNLVLSEGFINENNLGGAGVAGDYMNLAQGSLGVASGYINEASVNLSQARADESVGGTYGGLAARELSIAGASLNQAQGYIQELSQRLSISGQMDVVKRWGQEKLMMAQQELDNMRRRQTPKGNMAYARG